jgi:hypothetical protein
MSFEMSGKYGFRLLFMVTFYDHEEQRSITHGMSFYTPWCRKKHLFDRPFSILVMAVSSTQSLSTLDHSGITVAD